MPEHAAWVGIDLGTQSVRVLAVDDAGGVLGAATHAVRSDRAGGRHEQDPVAWLHAVRTCLRQVTAATSEAGGVVRGVAVASTSGTLVPVDADGAPTGAAVMYDDTRGAPFLDAVASAGAATWARMGYRMQASWALPTLLAMRADGAIAPGGRVAHQADVVAADLVGTAVATDASHALKTGVDLDVVAWPRDVLDALGVDASLLPDVVASGAVLGTVSQAAADATGLPVGCAVVAGMTDGCAAQIAAGALEPGDWSTVLGTTLVLKGVAAERPTGVDAVYAHRAPFELGWWPGGASSTGAGVLSTWLPDADLAALTERARHVAHPPLAYPLVGAGERFPFVAQAARAIVPAGSDAEVLAGAAVGVASIERLAFDVVAHAGLPVDGRRIATGGGSRNPWWARMRATLQQHPLVLPSASEGALGMAMLAAAGVDGEALPAVAARMRAASTTVDPEPLSAWLRDAHVALLDRLRAEGWLPSATHAVALAAIG
ncbi:FGGY-family carbohydrate kinase [Agrococcus sp. SGAir0287]|uniref:FGGY-family carbohydrate kinase n=1 Tax=Agrococcus sp. SGAir0287 TaxID=2070347 RepID=UPI0010CD33B1|nr:FGGY-family carbohydrate kinase [Agrococcus sp. SGAir0287]QCR18359.1 carbohydrate kinase [Agrococcus sp. SGAir0287]